MSQNYESPSEMTSARLVPYSQQWHRAKIVIRVVVFCLCAACYGLSFLTAIYAIAMGPLIIADAAWVIAEFIALAIRHSKKRGIHPIAHLILDTLFPLVYLYVGIEYSQDLANSTRHPRNAAAEAFVMVFLVALVILHSVLLVRSCIEVNQRMLARYPPKSMYFIPGQGAPFVADRACNLVCASTQSLPPKNDKSVT